MLGQTPLGLAGREKETIPIRIRSAINDCSARFRSISYLVSHLQPTEFLSQSLCGLLRGPRALGTVPVLLLVLDECGYAAVTASARCEIRDEGRDSGLRLSLIPRKAGLGVGCRCLCAHDPYFNTCFTAFSRVSIQISAVQNRWESMATLQSRMNLRMASICSLGNFSFVALCFSGWSENLADTAS